MGKMLKWILIGGLVIGAYMFLVPYSIKCKIPLIGDGCKATSGLQALGVDPNALPITQFDELLSGATNPEMAGKAMKEYSQYYKSQYARAQMLRGIH